MDVGLLTIAPNLEHGGGGKDNDFHLSPTPFPAFPGYCRNAKNWQTMPYSRSEVTAMATMNVSLPDLMRSWVESRIETGLYSNASDYVRDLIRRDQQEEQQRELLAEALAKGERSGISAKTLDDIWKSVKDKRR